MTSATKLRPRDADAIVAEVIPFDLVSIIVKQKWFEKNSSPYIRWIKGVYSHSIPV